jgi:hypothetical protein
VPRIVNSLGMGWVEAEDLKVGYPLYRGDQGTLAIAAIESERRVETVYNLSVANANTYFIGKDKVLVHNAKKGGALCYKEARKLPQEASKRFLGQCIKWYET